MKNANITAAIILGILLLMNVFSFVNINQRFITFLNSSLEQQTTLCGSYMESTLEDFESDLNKLLFENDFSSIFENDEVFKLSERSLEVFYAKYRTLITNIYIFDDQKNYFGLYINKKDHETFVVDNFTLQRQQPLSPRDKVEKNESFYLYHYPYFREDNVSGNIIVEIDFDSFAESAFAFYPKGRLISYKWVVNADGNVLSKTIPKETKIQGISEIADSIDMFAFGIMNHFFIDSTGKKMRVNSAYYPLSVFNQSLGIVFSASQSDFNRSFIADNMLVSVLSFIITLSLIIYLLIQIGRSSSRMKKLMMSEIAFRQIFEKYPIGLMILDKDNIIRNVNSVAQKLLFRDQKGDMVGKNLTKQDLYTKKYLLASTENLNEISDYLYYEKGGIETVVYRIIESARIGGEELNLIALIDVSGIERSRKQEVAANRAKSDFLASMSHEIRTPMNGILGMVAALMDSNLSNEQADKLKLIKKSSDLMMTIINDILDYSKIEAGKMLLEEIPFRLREEITLISDIFKSLAEEKGIVLETNIDASVPDKLIGDPFRLRQVISNLVSNAIKFTEKGKVLISCSLMEDLGGKLQLLFRVEDTGIGIPAENIGTIFNSFSQTHASTSRKYGGSGLGTAIAKQLVELMHGEIWVESPSSLYESDETPGSRFSFTIEAFSNEKIEKSYNYDSVFNLNQVTVLFLTKESAPEKNSITKILNSFGINIVTKIYQDSTTDTVIHHLSVKKDLYQVVILSDRNNNMDGFVLATKLKEERLTMNFPIIMVTNNDQPGNYRNSKKLDIDYYLIEPFESKEVYDIIKEIFPALVDNHKIETELYSLPKHLSILLVEDNIINVKVAQAIFKNIGYEIDLASNGAEALNMTKEKEYDIIFMDLYMPEVDGFEAAQKMRERGLKIPIIAMSANIEDQRKADSVIAGMDDYLSKPVKVEQVKQMLIKIFSKSIK